KPKMRTLTIFEETKTKTVKEYSDDIEAGVAKREKLEKEGICVFGCDKCQQQFSQQDKDNENYLIDYYGHFLAID
ncbi:25434_t:CDS:1, partial [Racocetra persica]